MESSTTVMIKNINGRCLSQQQQLQSMEPYYMSLPPKPPLRNSSYSSYLKPNHHHVINNQAADDSELSIFDAQSYFNESNNNNNIDSKVIISNRVSPINVDTTITAAAAAATNNNNNNNLARISEHRISSSGDVSALPRFSSSSSVDGYGRNHRTRSFNATPTASSEASWNSQTGLLSNPPGAIAVSMRNPEKNNEERKRAVSGSSRWQLFGRKCPCSGKKSVQVVEEITTSSEPKTPEAGGGLYNKKQQMQKSLEIPVEKSFPTVEIISNTRRISAENRFTGLGQQRVIASGRPYDSTTGFTFPILNQTPAVKLALNNNTTTTLEEPPRESLEIFQPPSEELENNRVPTVARKSFTFPTSPGRTRMTSVTDDDVASDASSDLFEIESFSTQTTSYPTYYNNHRRDSLDEASSFNARRLASATNGNNNLIYRSLDEPVTPSVAATEFYEPSEASIDWSVTTAEGFDRGSVTNFSVTASEVDDMAVMMMMRHESGGGGGGGKKKGNGGGMFVSCRCEKAVSVVGPNPVKCVAGSGGRHVNRRTCNVNSKKPPLARSQSHTLTLPFAT